MAPSKPAPRQQRLDVYNSTSTGHQVGSGVSKPAVYHRSRSARLQQQFKSDQAPLTTFLASAKTTTPGSAAATDKGAVATDPGSKTPAPAPESKRKIFAGCSIYINGSTAPRISDVELKRLLSHHGARISMALARKTTTHVIVSDMGGGLAAGKLQKEIAGKKNNIRYISVQWWVFPLFFFVCCWCGMCALTCFAFLFSFFYRALDSVTAGKRLSESRFSPLNLHSRNQKPLASVFPKVSSKRE